MFYFDIDEKVDMIKDICYALLHEYQEKYKHLKTPSLNASCDSTNAFSGTSYSSGGMGYTQDLFEFIALLCKSIHKFHKNQS